MEDLSKKLEILEKRIQQLESLQKDNLQMFGRSYALVGNSDSDFLIKTKGLVKIQWGNKFIDLIKDGKINVDSKFIFKESSIGIKDGIYVIGDGEDSEIWLVVGGSSINLKGEIGNTYVSFLADLISTSELKHQALKNIGFIYNSLDEFSISNGIQNGIIYIESELKLYIISQGIITPLTFEFPNPFTELFIISKNDDKIGALLIEGNGDKNSIKFNDMLLYGNNGSGIIDVTSRFIVKKGETALLTIDNNEIQTIYKISSNGIQSQYFTKGVLGYSIYKDVHNKWVLEIDKVIERDAENKLPSIPKYLNWNIVSKWEESDLEIEENEEEFYYYSIDTLFENSFDIDDILEVSTINEELEENTYELTVVSKTDNGLIIKCLDSVDDDLLGKLIYHIVDSDNPEYSIIRIKDNIDVTKNKKVISRIGNIELLELKEIIDEKEIPIKGYGMYFNNGVFNSAKYSSTYELKDDDNSSKFASTEWVNKRTTDINLTITDINVNAQSYFSRSDILQLLKKLKVNTSVSYVGKFGILTIAKSDRDYDFSAIVRARTEDSTWSHRSILATYDSLTDSWYNISTYIIKDLFNPGYYWSKNFNNGKPDSPEYIGTTDLNFIVSEEHPYLLYTNDGKTWKLINKYIPPVLDRIYVLSTNYNTNTDSSSGTRTIWPSGFLCYWKDDKSVVTEFGKSNYVEVNLYVNNIPTVLKLNTLLINAEPGNIPQLSGYYNLWSIQKDLDKSNPVNWKQELSGSVPVSLVYKETSDWGNSSALPGYTLWEVDEDNTIIGTPPASEFISGQGNVSNWSNHVWRNSFLKVILGETLAANSNNYNETLGWRFNYSGVLKSMGYAGYWTTRIGKLQDPDTDNKNEIGYMPAALFPLIYGEVMDGGELIQFTFINVKIGKELPYRYSLGGYEVGDKLYNGNIKLYKTSYEKCYYRRISNYLEFVNLE